MFEDMRTTIDDEMLKDDPTLRFLLALAFDALERADKAAQQSLATQIKARIRELKEETK
jgi:hypothetical protein